MGDLATLYPAILHLGTEDSGRRMVTAIAWVNDIGAHHVIDHSLPLAEQITGLGLGAPGFVFSTTQTDGRVDAIAQLISPQGRFGLIDDPEQLDISRFKRKSVSVHWEFMFTRWRSLSE